MRIEITICHQWTSHEQAVHIHILSKNSSVYVCKIIKKIYLYVNIRSTETDKLKGLLLLQEFCANIALWKLIFAVSFCKKN